MSSTESLREGLKSVAPEPENVPEESHESPKHPSAKSVVLRLLRGTQKYSAYGFSIFASMHLFSVLIAPVVSVSLANSSFMFTRSIYQSTIGEPTLIYGTLGAHLASGWMMHAYRVYSARRNYGKWTTGSNAITNSGALLTLLVAGHWAANRLSAIKALGDSSLISLDWITWALHDNPFQTGAALFLIVMVYGYHATAGIDKWFHLKLGGKKLLIVGALVGLASASLAALFRQPVPTGWTASQFKLVHNYMDSLFK